MSLIPAFKIGIENAWLPSDIHRYWYSLYLLDFPLNSADILPGPTLCFGNPRRTSLS